MYIEEPVKTIRNLHLALVLASAALVVLTWPGDRTSERAAVEELHTLADDSAFDDGMFRAYVDIFGAAHHYKKNASVEKTEFLTQDKKTRIGIFFSIDPNEHGHGFFRSLHTGTYMPKQDAPVKKWISWLSQETICQTIDVDYQHLRKYLAELFLNYQPSDEAGRDLSIFANLERIENLNKAESGIPSNAEEGLRYEMIPSYSESSENGVTTYRMEQGKMGKPRMHSYLAVFTIQDHPGRYEIVTSDPLAPLFMTVPASNTTFKDIKDGARKLYFAKDVSRVALSNYSYVNKISPLAQSGADDGMYLPNVSALVSQIGNDDVDSAIARLNELIYSPGAKVDLHGISVGKRDLLVLAPLLVLGLYALFACHLNHFAFPQNGIRPETSGFPWIGVFDGRFAPAAFLVSVLLPFGALVVIGITAGTRNGSTWAVCTYLVSTLLSVLCAFSVLRSWAHIHGMRIPFRFGRNAGTPPAEPSSAQPDDEG